MEEAKQKMKDGNKDKLCIFWTGNLKFKGAVTDSDPLHFCQQISPYSLLAVFSVCAEKIHDVYTQSLLCNRGN